MANKQIVDYSAGTFNKTDLFLSQPAAGGLYTKKALTELLGFKIYAFQFSQTGTSNPVITELLNTIGTITWTRLAVGNYRATSSGLFTGPMIFLPGGLASGAASLPIADAQVDSAYLSQGQTSNNACDLAVYDVDYNSIEWSTAAGGWNDTHYFIWLMF